VEYGVERRYHHPYEPDKHLTSPSAGGTGS
jgi:hypothetical protein